MSIQSVNIAALKQERPIAAYLELTYVCNWRCVFCYNPRRADVKRLTRDEWIEVVGDLRTLGALHVVLTGGEPMASPDFVDIARAVRANHMVLRVFTNGTLIDAAMAKELADLSASVEMSIHGADAATHDRTTGRAGSYEAALNALDLLQKENVKIELKTPLTSINEHQIDELIAFAGSRRIPFRFDTTMSPRDDGNLSALDLSVSPEGIRKAMRIALSIGHLKEQERFEGGTNCGLGRATLAVDPEGNVYPCLKWRKSAIGNVREMRLRDIWRVSEARKEAAAIAVAANTAMMQHGGAAAKFGFCPAIAATTAGDPLVPDAAFLHRAELAEQVRIESRAHA